MSPVFSKRLPGQPHGILELLLSKDHKLESEYVHEAVYEQQRKHSIVSITVKFIGINHRSNEFRNKEVLRQTDSHPDPAQGSEQSHIQNKKDTPRIDKSSHREHGFSQNIQCFDLSSMQHGIRDQNDRGDIKSGIQEEQHTAGHDQQPSLPGPHQIRHIAAR